LGQKTQIASLEEALHFVDKNPVMYEEDGKTYKILVIGVKLREARKSYIYRTRALLVQWLESHFLKGGAIEMYVPNKGVAIRPKCPPEILKRIEALNLST
jgi:hypothetical protein